MVPEKNVTTRIRGPVLSHQNGQALVADGTRPSTKPVAIQGMFAVRR